MEYKIKELMDVNRGASPRPIINFLTDRGYKWLKISDFKLFDRYVYNTKEHIIEDGIKKTRYLPKGTLILTNSATPGIPIFLGNDMCLHDGFLYFQNINERVINVKFLYYWLLVNRNKIVNQANGSVFQNLKKETVENFEIYVPNMKTQLKMVKILEKINDKIELNNQINNNLLEIGIELFKKELNSSNDTETLQNVIKFIKGKKPNDISSIRQEGYEKYLTIACLNAQELNYADTTKMVKSNNDLLMVMDGASSGEVYYGERGIVGSTLARVECVNNQYISEFIYFGMRCYRTLIQSKNTGSAIPHTDKVFVGTLEIPMLDYNQQEKYKVILANIQRNSHENETLKQLRDTLLPKLMNGEIDLDKIEI